MTEGRISPIPREARTYQGHRAGVVSRVAAAAIDAAVVALLLLAIYVGYAAMRFLLDPLNFTFPHANLVLSLTAGLLLLTLYLSAAWAISGRTYGCHVMGLRVVSLRGVRMTPVGALLRGVFCAFFPIGLLWCAVSRENRSVQDMVLRTSVVYDWRPRAQPPAGTHHPAVG